MLDAPEEPPVKDNIPASEAGEVKTNNSSSDAIPFLPFSPRLDILRMQGVFLNISYKAAQSIFLSLNAFLNSFLSPMYLSCFNFLQILQCECRICRKFRASHRCVVSKLLIGLDIPHPAKWERIVQHSCV
jgi:hypothetical protein